MSSQMARLQQDNDRLRERQDKILAECSGLKGLVAALSNITHTCTMSVN
jgi:hypothetical protein